METYPMVTLPFVFACHVESKTVSAGGKESCLCLDTPSAMYNGLLILTEASRCNCLTILKNATHGIIRCMLTVGFLSLPFFNGLFVLLFYYESP